MRNTWAICKREFAAFFLTPTGYVVVGTYALISGLGFTASFIMHCRRTQAPGLHGFTGVPDFEEMFLSPYLVFCGLLVMFIGPLVTMRLLAGERERGTMELLLTHPVRDREIVFGKYGAALGMLLVLMGVVGIHLLVVAHFVDVEPAVLAFGLLAAFLMGAAFMSMGLFISAMARSQATAGTLTFGLWFVFYILGTFAERIPGQISVPEQWPAMAREAASLVYAFLHGLVVELPLDAHAQDMAQGIVEPADIAYYVLFSGVFVFLTFRALESRKWRA